MASALGLAALTACTRDPDSSHGDDDGASDGGAPAAPDPATAFTKTTVPWGSTEVAVTVHPLVRREDLMVLTLDLQAEDLDGEVTEDLVSNFRYVWGSDNGIWRGVRLLDLTGDTVALPALDVDARVIANATDTDRHDGETLLEGSLQLVYSDLGVGSVDLYLPKSPLITGIPVLNAEVPELDTDSEPLDLAAVDSALLSPMITLSSDLLEPIRQQEDAESVTVSIGSDVLFDSSSATISSQAAAILDDVASRILEHDSGTVTVVGHTDSVDSNAANLDLSHRRADAVATALTSRIDTTKYPLETAGEGESEPIADNSTDKGRALNRRVELQISTPRTVETIDTAEAEAAPFEGITGTGDEGVFIESAARPFRLRAIDARFVSEHLVVTLEAVIEDDKVDTSIGLGGFSPLIDHGDAMPREHTDGGIGVLTGSTVTGPVFHHSGDDGVVMPLADLYSPSRIDGGVPRVLELVYPRGIAGLAPGGPVTLQYGRDGVRLTDIPISG